VPIIRRVMCVTAHANGLWDLFRNVVTELWTPFMKIVTAEAVQHTGYMTVHRHFPRRNVPDMDREPVQYVTKYAARKFLMFLTVEMEQKIFTRTQRRNVMTEIQ